MTTIGSLISPTLKQTLMGAVAINEAVAPSLTAPAATGRAFAARDVNEALVTTINGVEYDVRGEALVQTNCADCPAHLLVEVAPKGVDLDLLCSKPRVTVCEECGHKRVAGKSGTLIHHKPQEAPVEIDLTKYSEAELAQLAIKARARMVAEKEAEIPEKRTKAQKAEAKRIRKDQALKEQQREERKAMTYPGLSLTIKGQHRDVPALDLSEVTDLNEVVSPAMRSPYNKALYALGMDLLGKDAATYAVVAETHIMLAEHADAPASFEALATVVEPEAKAKVDRKGMIAAYAEVMGVSKKASRKHLEKVGVL